MASPYILAIDQGTTGTKALIVDENLAVVAEATIPFQQHFPKPGWVEHDPEEIWESVIVAIHQATQGIDVKRIAAIGITNQRETICFWERGTGKAFSNAIVWQDRRTAETCEQLKAKGLELFFEDNTGLLLDPYFSGTKVSWALQNWPAVAAAQKAGTLAAGTVDSFLMARLSGGTAHVTEPSNASRTLCFHLKTHKWEKDLCNALNVPQDIWPHVLPSTGKFTVTHSVPGLPDGIPITGVLGDQQAALLGQACVDEGTAKCTYGTGAFMLLNTGSKPVKSRHRLLTTIAWATSETQYTYALEGSAFVAGAAVQWARDGLGIIQKSSDIEGLAASVPTTDGVVFVPSLTGMGAPHWDPTATGMLTGLTRGTTKAHIARAILEGIAFQNADILLAMQKDLGKSLKSLNVDGGASANDLLMQFQADVLGVDLQRPVVRETTSLGAVFAAGLGAGIWTGFDAIKKAWKREKTYTPAFSEKDREQALKRWHLAVQKTTYKPKLG